MQQISDILGQVQAGTPMSEAQAEAAFSRIFAGEVADADLAQLLTLIAARGPTVDELVGGARVMRRHVTRVRIPDNEAAVIDTCGTGGAPKLFNISTAGAIVTAAAAPGRVMVAKHGSLSRSGRGSAEVLAALGVKVDAAPEVQTRCLDEIGVCFSFSVHHHPAMKHAAAVRKALGFPTIFNLLGPLTNPAGARRQLIGTYSDDLAQKLAETLRRLGVDRAMVVTSRDGLDEITTSDVNIARTIENGRISADELEPQAFGFSRTNLDQLRVNSLEQAASIMQSVVAGVQGPTLDIVLLNAGASLFVAGVVDNVGVGVEIAREAVARGAAKQTLADLIRLSNTG